jgi:endonuclease III
MDKRNTPEKKPRAKISARGGKPGKAAHPAMPKTGKRAPNTPRAQQTSPNSATIAEIFRRFEAANPHPEGELAYINPFTLLVAVVLSAQATDTGVNKATRALFACADSPEKMLALGEDKVRAMIQTIGLFRAKARNVIALSERLLKDFNGEVPRSREALETLAGVGRKTANVVLNIAFGVPVIAVDTHVFRVSNRIPLAPGKTPLEVEAGLEKIIPVAYKHHAHHWLILHGRYICKALRPECPRCLISDLCQWPDKRV